MSKIIVPIEVQLNGQLSRAERFPETEKLLALNRAPKKRLINGIVDGLKKPQEVKPMGERARARLAAQQAEAAKKKADQQLAAQGGRFTGEKKASKPQGFSKKG